MLSGAPPSSPSGSVAFHPRHTNGVLLGGALVAWAFVFTGLLVARGLTQDVSLSALACYLVATVLFASGCLFAYWTYARATLGYVLDRNGLSIHWGFIRQVVPLDKIERVVPGPPGFPVQIQGLNWPGYHVGRGFVERIGETLFYSTHNSPEELLYVVTPTDAYAVSVADGERFVAEVHRQQQAGVAVSLRQTPRRSLLAAQPFWQDGLAQLLAIVAILVCAATFGVVYARYGDLPNSLAMSFPPLDVTRVADKSELLSLPTTAFGLLLINLILALFVHAWERLTAYLLLVALVGLQTMFLVGAAIAVS
jgi:Bacterial PH domain